MNTISLRRTLYSLVAVGLVSLSTRIAKADVVIGDFENGSLDGWTSPQETIASVAGKGNSLGGSSVGVSVMTGQFWGLQ